MSGRSPRTQRVLGWTLAVLGLGACGDAPTAISPEEAALAHADHQVAADATLAADYHQQLASLRRATAPFHSFEKAQEAGWTLRFTPCIVSPAGAGGMGYHYVNEELMDATLDVATPEALLYEPDANGRLRLVAVEYLVPFDIHPHDAAPPELFGLPFARSMPFKVWGLHAWVWKHNPSGMHAPFNPVVDCDDA